MCRLFVFTLLHLYRKRDYGWSTQHRSPCLLLWFHFKTNFPTEKSKSRYILYTSTVGSGVFKQNINLTLGTNMTNMKIIWPFLTSFEIKSLIFFLVVYISVNLLIVGCMLSKCVATYLSSKPYIILFYFLKQNTMINDRNISIYELYERTY